MEPSSFKRSVTQDLSDVSPPVSRGALVDVIKGKFSPVVVLSIQFVPVKRVQITFEDPKMKGRMERYDTIDLNGVKCKIVSGGPTAQNVLIYHFPFEEDNAHLQAHLSPFGKVLRVRLQHYPDMPDISTGTCIVRMVPDKPIPRNLTLGSYRDKCWYVGQPTECDICRGAHEAKDNPLRGKCQNCWQEGHLARDCPNPPKLGVLLQLPHLLPQRPPTRGSLVVISLPGTLRILIL